MTLTLQLTSPAATLDTVTASADPTTGARALAGLALPFGAVGRTSAGPVTCSAGVVTVPADLRRVKLFTEHGRTAPVGYAVEASETPEGLRMAFRVAATPAGEAALLEASEGARDALSVELDDVTIAGGKITAGTLTAVALVALPAFADARLAASYTTEPTEPTEPADPQNPDILTPSETHEQDEPDTPTPPADPTATPDPSEDEPTMTTPPSLNAAAPPAPALTASAVVPVLAAALSGAHSAEDANQALQAALTDITPAGSGTDALAQPQWLGELWTPLSTQRDLIGVFGAKPLTAMRWLGWKWETRPKVARYPGNKAAVPSSPAKIVPADGEAYRIAGAWDMDRIYVDFNTGFVEAFLDAAAVDYSLQSENELAAVLLEEATVPPESAGSFIEALDLSVRYLLKEGASLSFVAMAADVWGEFINLKGDDVPWWLKAQGTVNLGDISTNVGGIRIFANHSIPSGGVLAGDKRAVDFRETGPIRVQAVNIPNGGIDAALFGYQGQVIHDARGLVKLAVPVTPPAAPPAAPAAKKAASSS